jgi:hypothetical protein
VGVRAAGEGGFMGGRAVRLPRHYLSGRHDGIL